MRAWLKARHAPARSTHFEDFAPYEPSYNDAAAFVSAPVYKDGVLVAVLAMQLPVDRINGIVNESTGLGSSGHAFLVGDDGRMRTQDSLTTERTIFVRQVATDAVRAERRQCRCRALPRCCTRARAGRVVAGAHRRPALVVGGGAR